MHLRSRWGTQQGFPKPLRRWGTQQGFLALLLLGLSACSRACNDPAPARGEALPPPSALAPDPLGPPSRAELPTTDGIATMANLEGQIGVLEGLLRGKPGHVTDRRSLVPLLSARSRFAGRIADAERALSISEDLVHEVPAETWPLLLRAGTRAALHLFPAALADLADAEKRGVVPVDLAEQRAAVLEAQGDLDGALSIHRAAYEAEPDLTNGGLLASLLGRLGRTDEAKSIFLKAQDGSRYPSLSTFPVAWLFLQEGLFWESTGETNRARAFYEAAHDRLPAFGHAASHLAVLVPPARGIELLTPIVATSDDPEFEMILARRLRAAGRRDEAEARLAHVTARYAELVDRHPEAFAEHAASFLLDEGKSPDLALALARKNLTVRRTPKAYELALLAALAAGHRDEACDLGREAKKLPHAGEMLRAIADRACQ